MKKIVFAILSLSLVSCAVEGLEETIGENTNNTNTRRALAVLIKDVVF